MNKQEFIEKVSKLVCGACECCDTHNDEWECAVQCNAPCSTATEIAKAIYNETIEPIIKTNTELNFRYGIEHKALELSLKNRKKMLEKQKKDFHFEQTLLQGYKNITGEDYVL